jgi:8-oxo-dGTP pyrophosphatase MutT (NUDIX family)
MRLPFNTLIATGFAEHQIRTTWSERYRDIPVEVAPLVAEAWDTAKREAEAKGRHLFSGAMARLNCWSVTNGVLSLDLGPTDYREFVGTNLRHPELATQFGRDALACPLGISIAVRTADKRIVVQQRSEAVFEYPGFFHVCGGNVEPKDVGGANTRGVFASVRRELEEELGIESKAIKEEVCLGLAENARTLKPELLTEARVTLRENDFGSARHDEYTGLWFIDAKADGLAGFLTAMRGQIAPGGLACLLALGRREFGESWWADAVARGAQRQKNTTVACGAIRGQ